MFVCVFSIVIQTAGQILMKSGTDVVLEGGKVGGGVQPSTPTPWVQGAYRGSEVPLEPQSCILKKSSILSISCYEVANSHGTSHWPTGGHHHTVFQL